MKKIFLTALFLFSTVFLTTIAASAAGGTCAGNPNASWSFEMGALTFRGTGSVDFNLSQMGINRLNVRSVTAESGITRLRGDEGMIHMDKLTLPETLQTIGGFNSCALETLILPSSVTEIEAGSFNGCSASANAGIRSGLKTVILSSGLESIPSTTFYNCSDLIRVSIPESITAIESGAFSNCLNIHHIYYEGTEAQWNSAAFPAEAFLDAALHCRSLIDPACPVPPAEKPVPASELYTTLGGDSLIFHVPVPNGDAESGRANVKIRGFNGMLKADGNALFDQNGSIAEVILPCDLYIGDTIRVMTNAQAN